MARNSLAHDEPYRHGSGYLIFNDRYVHRAVWEEANGPIPKGFVVHHINGNKQDNRLENLQLMSHSEHSAQHHRGRVQTPEHKAKRLAAMEGFHSAGGSLAYLSADERTARARAAALARWGR